MLLLSLDDSALSTRNRVRGTRSGSIETRNRNRNRNRNSDRGAVTAEFAIVLPAVVLVLACCITGVRLAVLHLQLQDAAASAARIIGRGESLAAAQSLANQLVPTSTVTASLHGTLVCIEAHNAERGAMLPFITVSARSCALNEATQ